MRLRRIVSSRTGSSALLRLRRLRAETFAVQLPRAPEALVMRVGINSCAPRSDTPTRATATAAQGTDAEHPQAGSCQTAKDDGGKPGVRFLARSKRGTRFRTTSLLGGTRQRGRRFCSPWVGRDQGRRHCRWRSPDDRNWLSFHDRYQYTLSREAVWLTLRSSSKSAQRDSQFTLYEHDDNSKLTSHALKENRALTATAIQKVGPDRP